MSNSARILPEWAEDLRRRYLRGEASMFVLHGNVYDSQVVDKTLVTLTDFLSDVLFKETRETIAIYNVATGVYEDLIKAGVVDPAKVTRSALQHAASISGLLLTTEAIVTEAPEKNKAAGGGDPHGHPPGGMDY